MRCEKDLKDNKDNSLHLGRKHARIFVLGHYLFLVAHSFPRASLSENCSLLRTDNVRGQISEHIFAPNGDYCLFIFKSNSELRVNLIIILQIFSLTRRLLKIREYHWIISQFYLLHIYSRDVLDQWRVSKRI